MTFHEYIQYRCINLNKVVKETGISYGKLRNPNCPNNLDKEDLELLKERLGDWDLAQKKRVEEGVDS